jgi:small-conductance mechanosensitive channel
VHQLRRLVATPHDIETTLFALALAVALAGVVAGVCAALTRRLLSKATHADLHGRHRPTVVHLVRLVRSLAWLILSALFFPPMLEIFDEKVPGGLSAKTLSEWAISNGLHVLLIGVLAFVLVRAVGLTVTRFEEHITSSDAPEVARRARTLTDLIRNVSSALIVSVATLMMLQELGINIMPVLTGAGILGLAVGFGAQTLVKDVISGFFVILEDQIRVGDVAEINGVAGAVEAINLRTLLLRDERGAVHVFPCGSIAQLANLTKDFAYATIDVRVPADQSVDRAITAMRDVLASMRADATFGPAVLGDLEMLGVSAIGGDPAGRPTVAIHARVRAVPLRQWEVGRELRLRVTRAFESQGLQIR